MEPTFQEMVERKRANGELTAETLDGPYYTRLNADGKVEKIYHKRRHDD